MTVFGQSGTKFGNCFLIVRNRNFKTALGSLETDFGLKLPMCIVCVVAIMNNMIGCVNCIVNACSIEVLTWIARMICNYPIIL